MEKKHSAYFYQAHRTGKIATVIAIIIMVGIPVAFSLYYGAWPQMDVFLISASALIAIYLPQAIANVFAYTTILGSSTYMTFITGNVTNLKIPCALNAIDMTDSEPGTDRADAVSSIAVAASSIVTMVIIAIGVVLIQPLQPLLNAPTFQTATKFLLPSLFGAMVTSNLLNKKSQGHTVTNRWVILAVNVAIVTASYFIFPLITGGTRLQGKEGYMLIAFIPITIGVAYLLFKSGIVKATPVAAPAKPAAAPAPVENSENDEQKPQ